MKIVNVEDRLAGSALAAPVVSGATQLAVVDPSDFDGESGQVRIGEEVRSYSQPLEEELVLRLATGDDLPPAELDPEHQPEPEQDAGPEYSPEIEPEPETIPDEDFEEVQGRIYLDAALTGSYGEDDYVAVEPPSMVRVAWVSEPEQNEQLEAIVAHSLYDRVGVGMPATPEEGLVVEVEYQDTDLVVVDVIGEEPVIDAGFLDPDTLPEVPGGGTDGNPPASSPAPRVRGGIGALVVEWDPVPNPDTVTYEVHVSTVDGFTPSADTLAGELAGTLIFIRNLPS